MRVVRPPGDHHGVASLPDGAFCVIRFSEIHAEVGPRTESHDGVPAIPEVDEIADLARARGEPARDGRSWTEQSHALGPDRDRSPGLSFKDVRLAQEARHERGPRTLVH